MRHLLTAIIVSIIAIVLFMAVDWRNIDLSLSLPTFADSSRKKPEEPFQFDDSEVELWVDTVAHANGHSFGYSGDVTEWGGWYYDTIPVGDDIMLSYDSVEPTSLKLSLVTREFIVDLNDSDAPEKIKQFLNPLKGFKRFQKDYAVDLDSIVDDNSSVKTNY